MALQGFGALVKAESSAIVFTDEATTTSDNKTYVVPDMIFAYGSDIVVEDGGTETTEDYTVNWLEGSVTFATADEERVITVSGEYVTLSTIAYANEFAFNGTRDLADITAFGQDSKVYYPTLVSAEATIRKFYEVDGYFVNLLADGLVKVFELYADADAEPFRFYGLISGDTVGAVIDGMIEESITIQTSGKMILGG